MKTDHNGLVYRCSLCKARVARITEPNPGQCDHDGHRMSETAADYCDQLERENAELKQRLAEIEEREAACCPEDVGFDEYIEGLKDIIKQMRYALRVALPEARSTHCEKTIAVALKAAEGGGE